MKKFWILCSVVYGYLEYKTDDCELKVFTFEKDAGMLKDVKEIPGWSACIDSPRIDRISETRSREVYALVTGDRLSITCPETITQFTFDYSKPGRPFVVGPNRQKLPGGATHVLLKQGEQAVSLYHSNLLRVCDRAFEKTLLLGIPYPKGMQINFQKDLKIFFSFIGYFANVISSLWIYGGVVPDLITLLMGKNPDRNLHVTEADLYQFAKGISLLRNSIADLTYSMKDKLWQCETLRPLTHCTGVLFSEKYDIFIASDTMDRDKELLLINYTTKRICAGKVFLAILAKGNAPKTYQWVKVEKTRLKRAMNLIDLNRNEAIMGSIDIVPISIDAKKWKSEMAKSLDRPLDISISDTADPMTGSLDVNPISYKIDVGSPTFLECTQGDVTLYRIRKLVPDRNGQAEGECASMFTVFDELRET